MNTERTFPESYVKMLRREAATLRAERNMARRDLADLKERLCWIDSKLTPEQRVSFLKRGAP